MSNLYRVQATVWIVAESPKAAADEVFDEISTLTKLDTMLRGVEVENDGELVEESE